MVLVIAEVGINGRKKMKWFWLSMKLKFASLTRLSVLAIGWILRLQKELDHFKCTHDPLNPEWQVGLYVLLLRHWHCP